MNLSDNIRSIRKDKSLTQTEVAKRYGTSPEFYHRLEKKDKTLTIEQLEKIADALEVTVVELLYYQQAGYDKESKDLRKQLEELEVENSELITENETLINNNQTLFDQVKFYQDLIKGFMGNPEGLQKFVDVLTGGNTAVIENLKQTATDLFPDVAAQIGKLEQPPTDN